MINFLHLSALLSLTSALCLQRNAKKMNGANISPSFYSFFFSSQFLFLSCCFFLPSFLPFLSFLIFLSFFSYYPIILSFSSSCYFFLCLFFLSLSLFRFVFPCVPILIPPFLFLLFLFLLLSFFRRVQSTAKVPYRQRQASSQILCPLSQSTISVRNLTRHASLCLLHCRLLCKL